MTNLHILPFLVFILCQNPVITDKNSEIIWAVVQRYIVVGDSAVLVDTRYAVDFTVILKPNLC